MHASVFVALTLIAALATGCMTYQRQGDKAFERGDCNEALAAYERAMERNPEDSQLYYRAAKCALRMGDFAASERYFSKSLRYGGGLDVAKELASFYVKTSNYVSAVRVYQYLLYQTEEKQPIYNNLGTALMYAGQYFDAESYLMVAQQMAPDRPTPYLNLGVLYDRHLRQPWLAINFYECCEELAPRAQNIAMITQRSKELKSRYSRMYQAEAVECGEPYEPRASKRPVSGLKKVVDLELGTDETKSEDDGPADDGEAPVGDAATKGDETQAPTKVPIDRMVDEVEPPVEEVHAGLLERGRRAFAAGKWAEAVDALTKVPVADLSAADQKRLGLAYLKQANWTLAAHWLGLARVSAEDPELVDGLLVAHGKLGQTERVAELCREFRKRPKYEKLVEQRCENDDAAE